MPGHAPTDARRRSGYHRSRAGLIAVAVLIACSAALPLAAQDTISIDFQGGATQAMDPSEVAGVIARSHWNNAAGQTGSNLALNADDGSATGATASWNSNNIYQTTITEVAGNARMMVGYLDTSNTSSNTVSITGLPSLFARYDVYVYTDANIGGQTSNAHYSIAGAPGPLIDSVCSGSGTYGNFNGTFVKGNGTEGNYIIFRGLTMSSFTLIATPVSGSVPRAPINGIQIVALAPVAHPLAVTGFTQDVVMENASNPTLVPFDQSNPAANASVWIREGTGGHADGFPLAALFFSEATPQTQYALGPQHANNVLWLTNATTPGTLTLATPVRCHSLYILASSGSGAGTGTATIHFADSTMTSVSYDAPDWGTTPAGKAIALGRLGRSLNDTSLNYDHAVNFNLFETYIDLSSVASASTSPITAVDFAMAFPGGVPQVTGIFALSAVTYGPTVTAISPTIGSAAGGDAVTITGSGFTGATSASIGGVAITSFMQVDDHHITGITAAGLPLGPDDVVVVSGIDHGTLSGGFIATGTPTVTGVAPNHGTAAGGALITITGTGFVTGASVTVGGQAATSVAVLNATTITASTPALISGAALVDVTVTNPGGLSGTDVGAYTYDLRDPENPTGTTAGLNYLYYRIAGPTLPNFAAQPPDVVGVRADATINGANPIESRNDNWCMQFLGYVSVPTAGVYNFYTASDDGSQLYIGNQLVVDNNFAQGVTERSGTIGLKAGVHALTVRFAQGIGGFGLFVRYDGPGISKQDIPDGAFSTDAPVLASVAPSVTPGDNMTTTPITLTGSGFVATPTVYIGSVAATGIGFTSGTTVTATAPAANPGGVRVLVINPDGKAAQLSNGFVYQNNFSPAVSSILPVSGTYAGGTSVTITGTHFSNATVTVGGQAAAVSSQNATQIVITTPAIGSASVVDVIVTNDDLQTATSPQQFTYTGLRAPENPVGTQAGLAYKYYRVAGGSGGVLPADFNSVTPDLVGILADPYYNNNNPIENSRPNDWAAQYIGYLTVPNDGVYTLFTASDDGSRLYIGNTLVVDNNFSQGVTERSGNIALLAGTHLLTIQSGQGMGGFALSASWQGPLTAKATIPDAAFSTYAIPTISGIVPDHGPFAGGTAITVTGTGFSPGSTLDLGGTTPASVTVVNATSITATTVANAIGAVTATVTNVLGFSGTRANGFAFQGPTPAISGISPSSGSYVGGYPLTITGTDFNGATVAICGQAASITSQNATTIVITVPPIANLAVGDVVITNVDLQTATSPQQFSYTGLRVPENPAGSVAGLFARYYAVNPPGDGTLPDFTTLTPDLSSIVADPDFNNANPFDGAHPNGWSAEWTGYVVAPTDGLFTFFTRSDDGSRLFIGNTLVVDNDFSQPATERSGSIALLAGLHLVTIQYGQGGGQFEMTASYQGPGLAKQTIPDAAFHVLLTPTLTGVAPAVLPLAGGTITLTGTNFAAGAIVTIDGVAASGVTVVNATTITATAPAAAIGPKTSTVAVINPDQQSASVTWNYMSQGPQPTLTNVAPAVGPLTGGTAVTLTGTNFAGGATVQFGGQAATGVTVVNATTITATTPAGSQGPAAVVVTNVDTLTASLASGFTFQGAAPIISGVSPAALPLVGGTVTISGANFVAGATLTFNGSPLAATFVNSSTITFTAPAASIGPASVTLVVTNIDQLSASATWNYTSLGAVPTLTGVVPGIGPIAGGTSVTLTGTNFAGGATVQFGGQAATGITVVNATTITATTPAGAQGPAGVVVTNVDNQSATLASGFTFQGAPPSISGVSPTLISQAGGTVTISGANFVAGATLTFNGSPLTATVVDASTITFTAPAAPIGPGSATLVVTNIDQLSASTTWNFTALGPAPTLASVTPGVGPLAGGTAVTLTGTNFNAGATVQIGGQAATGVTVVNATSITATTPAGAQGPAAVVVTNIDTQTATLANGFIFQGAPPTISGVSPATLPLAGGTVTISGSNFVAGVTLTFNGTPLTATFVDASTITFIAPAAPIGPGSATLVITNIDQLSATTTWNYIAQGAAPSLTSVSPGNGPTVGGTTVTLIGTNFAAGATVQIGGQAATGVTVVNATTITATTPAGAQGPAAVVVTNVDAQSATLASGFIYRAAAPSISSVSPGALPLAGGTVTISGANFAPGATLTFNGSPLTATVVNASTLTFTAPAAPIGPASATLVVTNVDLQSASVTWHYISQGVAPTITGITPDNGLLDGGTTVHIFGTGFVLGATVSFGGIRATIVTVVSATDIIVVSPGGNSGPVDVTVTNVDDQSATLSGAFTYPQRPPSSSSHHHCGHGGVFGAITLLTLFVVLRAPGRSRRPISSDVRRG